MKLTKKEKEQQKLDAIIKIKGMLKPGQSVYTSVISVSSSGMSRKINVYIVDGSEISDITWLVSRAIGYSRDDKTGALKVSGTGMDMGFHVVYSMNSAVFNDGYATKQRWL